MKKHTRHVLVALAASVVSSTIASAVIVPTAEFSESTLLAQTTAPTADSPTQKLEVEILGIEGMVQVRADENSKWTKAEVGMKLSELAEFRTGPKSAVQCRIGPDQTMVLDRLGTVKVAEAVLNDKMIKTDLMMKYGRVRLDVETAGVEHRSVISSPSSTLAVRGTKVSLYDQRPFAPEAVSLTGTAEFRDGKKQILFGKKNQGKTKVNSEKENAAELTIASNTVDPTAALARTNSEAKLIDSLISKGATVSFDRFANIQVVRGGSPLTDAQLIPTLPGSLTFVARWNSNSDLNFGVGNSGGPKNTGEIIYPTGITSHDSKGGVIPFDHRGGPNGGMEIIYYPRGFPDGIFTMGLTLISGKETSAQVDVFRDGKRIKFNNGQGEMVSTFKVDVPTPIPGFSDATAAGSVAIGVDLPSGRKTLNAQRVRTRR